MWSALGNLVGGDTSGSVDILQTTELSASFNDDAGIGDQVHCVFKTAIPKTIECLQDSSNIEPGIKTQGQPKEQHENSVLSEGVVEEKLLLVWTHFIAPWYLSIAAFTPGLGTKLIVCSKLLCPKLSNATRTVQA